MEIFDIAPKSMFVICFVCCFDEDVFVSCARSKRSQEYSHKTR